MFAICREAEHVLRHNIFLPSKLKQIGTFKFNYSM